jgi:two-component system, LuxR family, response regulator FixJ
MTQKGGAKTKIHRPRALAKPDPATVILVDDDFLLRQALCRLLREDGLNVISFARPSEVLSTRLPKTNAVLILDIHLPEMTGVALYKKLVARNIRIPTILITGHRDEMANMYNEGIGAVAVLFKPIEEKELLEAIGRALERSVD